MNVRRASLVLSMCTLTACNGSSQSLTGIPCPAIVPFAAGTLNYPKAGSTGVPDSVGLIVVSGGSASGPVYLQSSTGTAVVPFREVPVPSPLPTPNTAVTDPIVTAFAIPQLMPGTKYTVVEQGSPNCYNPDYGSFTTR